MTEAEDRQRLLSYVTEARWFGGKGRSAELTGVSALPWLTEAGSWPAVRVEIVEINYLADTATGSAAESGPSEFYQIPVSYRPAPHPDWHFAEIWRIDDPELGPVVGYDAVYDPQACQLLLAQLLRQARSHDGETSTSFHLTDRGALTGTEEPEVFAGQQSNTSIMFGQLAMLKVFRRLELGHNLDIEVHEALSRDGIADVAKLFGWFEGSWRQGDTEVTADLGMLVERFKQAEDGWGLALDSLSERKEFATEAAALGRALAEIHGALRTSFPTGQLTGAAVAATMAERVHRAAAIAAPLRDLVPGLLRCFDALAGQQLSVQRVHGDFHLGQTLRTPDGWKIIDFEGEPAKTLAERSAPDSVWRDVAGMLRSFDYAAASVPGAAGAEWAAACRSAFLEGYTGRLSPEELIMLQAYEADKAVYEVIYEVRNRPDWVNIPLAAVAAIANSSAAAGS
ncbi:phosphotransferase [Microlunatus panaciterrae]|uniref:Maltokinase n=1 Tax=Microlunatus panaciterrae TaxID=400768 RepID=A0ABS2RED8_9ACTN|nr:phosphotransferase [Microlunatus panaciterrae]MBM7797351.1 maltokinase [Microlunatus panaciterrae]